VDLGLELIFAGELERLSTLLELADVLPRLMTLRLRYRVEDEESFDPLLDALRSRQQFIEGRDTFEAFHLQVGQCSVLPPIAREKLLAFEEKGMHISIESEY